MALTWREERPEAITAASHSAERPSRSMVTIFSALSSSREVRMRLSRSLGAAALRAPAADFLGIGFLTAFGAGFFAGFPAGFLAGFFAGFWAGTFFAAFALAAGFLAVFGAAFLAALGAALRVRAKIL
jgi:hypothetical protein